MTIPNTARKAGPLLGTGSQTAWPFTFKVFAAGDVQVTIANSSGTETLLVLGTDYTVTLNSNQETSPGGTVNYPISGSALPVGSVLAIIGDLDYDQPLDLPSGGNFSPTALENQLDRSTMQIQQLREEMNRTAKLPPTSTESVEELVDDLQRLADSADNIDTLVANIADVTTVANDLNEPVSEINTVADNIANVNAVGTNITNVNAVAANATNINAAVANATNINAVVANATNINAAVANATNINAVVANEAAIDTVVANIADVNTVADNVSAINTVVDNLSAWRDVTAGDDIQVTNFNGTGSQVAFTLPFSPGAENNTQVYISGVYQQKDRYTVSGTTLTFSSAPPSGTANIEVVWSRPFVLGATDAALVSFTPAGTAAEATTVQAAINELNELNYTYRGIAIYVDSVSGNDANNGITSGAAVKTLARALALVAGQIRPELYLRRGSVFREQFQLPNNSKVMAYGLTTSAKPIVSGADLLANSSFTLAAGKTYTYQISLPSISSSTNPYVSVTNSDVLMVWENNTRMGLTFNESGYTRPTSIDAVEATAGSFWWDSVNKILYIHPADNSNPSSNGKAYEASVRTLAIHGGDNVFVENIDAEKSGAKTTSGQQGYAILGYRSGVYRSCTGRYGWNHLIGVANDQAAADLVFEYCVAEDCERQNINAPTLFIAYKSGSKPSRVVFKDCVAKQLSVWTGNTSYAECGFYAHGDAILCEYRGVNTAINPRYGAQLVRDGSNERVANIVNGKWVFQNCVTGMLISSSAENDHAIILHGKNNTSNLQTFRSCYVSGYIFISGNQAGIFANSSGGAAVVVTVRDTAFIRETAPATQNDGTGVQNLNALAVFDLQNCLFHQLGCPLRGSTTNPVSASDFNTFSACIRIYSDTNLSPSFGTTLAGWQSASGKDTNSNSTTQAISWSDKRFPSTKRPDLAMPY